MSEKLKIRMGENPPSDMMSGVSDVAPKVSALKGTLLGDGDPMSNRAVPVGEIRRLRDEMAEGLGHEAVGAVVSTTSETGLEGTKHGIKPWVPPAKQATSEAVKRTPERQLTKEERRELLFAPPETSLDVNEDNSEFNFSALLDNDRDAKVEGERYIKDRAVEAAGEQKFKITDETVEHATRMLAEAVKDTKVRDILSVYNIHDTGANAVASIRQNTALRLQLAGHFLGKMDRISDALPDRVKKNEAKSMSYAGYNKLSHELGSVTSREYATRMCLNMLDGTYDSSREQVDPIDYDEKSGKYVRGQHRQAAYTTLLTPSVT